VSAVPPIVDRAVAAARRRLPAYAEEKQALPVELVLGGFGEQARAWTPPGNHLCRSRVLVA
jgi:hypothetical protein